MTGVLSGRMRPVGLIFDNLVNAPKSALAMMTDRVKGPKSSRVGQADFTRLVPFRGMGHTLFCLISFRKGQFYAWMTPRVVECGVTSLVLSLRLIAARRGQCAGAHK
jgi:hypothetical protein